MSDDRTNKPPTGYPECEKWAKVHDDAVTIINFTEWVENNYGEMDEYLRPKTEQLLYEYFEIDPKKLEAERSAMLDSLRLKD